MPKQLTYENYTMLAAGGTKSFSVSDNVDIYNLLPNGGGIYLGVNLIIDVSGTPTEGMQFVFNYGGGVVYDPSSVTILGRTLTAAEALTKYIVVCTYINGAWVVRLLFGSLSSVSGAYLADGTVTNAKLAGSIDPTKFLASVRGYLYRANASGIWGAFSAVTSGNLVMGNGTDVVSQAMSGDATLSGTGVLTLANNAITTVKITDANVTVAKVSADLKAEMVKQDASFEAGELGAYTFRMPYPGSVTHFYVQVTKVMGGTDAGTVILKNNAGTTMTATTPVSIPLATAIGTAYSTAITANNTFVAGDIITVFTAKPTAGGKITCSVGIVRS